MTNKQTNKQTTNILHLHIVEYIYIYIYLYIIGEIRRLQEQYISMVESTQKGYEHWYLTIPWSGYFAHRRTFVGSWY